MTDIVELLTYPNKEDLAWNTSYEPSDMLKMLFDEHQDKPWSEQDQQAMGAYIEWLLDCGRQALRYTETIRLHEKSLNTAVAVLLISPIDDAFSGTLTDLRCQVGQACLDVIDRMHTRQYAPPTAEFRAVLMERFHRAHADQLRSLFGLNRGVK